MKLFKWTSLVLPFQLASAVPISYTASLTIEARNDADIPPISVIGRLGWRSTSKITKLTRCLAAILNIVTDVISLVEDIFETLEDLNEAESKFTTEVVSQLAAQYPDKNILIYHGTQDHHARCLGDCTNFLYRPRQ